MSLICSDHPLSYSLPIKIFGKGRLPESGSPGISVFDLQTRIGQSSPEIHAFFPRNLSVRQVLENAWADTFLSNPNLTYHSDLIVDACLRWFEPELNPAFDVKTTRLKHGRGKVYGLPRDVDWADRLSFGESSFSAQRVALFLRAIIKKPELIILDEAFSGMDDYVRDKCMLFMIWGETRTFAKKLEPNSRQPWRYVGQTRSFLFENRDLEMIEGLEDKQTLICVSHVKEEVPPVVSKWLCLPEASTGMPVRFGDFERPLDSDQSQWENIWGLEHDST